MTGTQPGDARLRAVRRTYDTVADRYAAEIGDELAHKPLERALLATLAELCAAQGGVLGDVGCGPGHLAGWLAGRGVPVLGVDLSPAMIAVARRQHPGAAFAVGSMLALPVADGAWSGALAAFSIIHLDAGQRRVAFAELARAVRPGGWALVSFHVSDAEHRAGGTKHLTQWWDRAVDVDTYFLDPAEVAAGLVAAGFAVQARVERDPWPGSAEYPSRRAHLLARREQRCHG